MRAQPTGALAELIWNSLDGEASRVSVEFERADLGEDFPRSLSMTMAEAFPDPKRPPAPGQASEVAQVWALVEHTTSVAVIDEFIRQYGNMPIYGALARTRRQQVAKDQGKPQPGSRRLPSCLR